MFAGVMKSIRIRVVVTLAALICTTLGSQSQQRAPQGQGGVGAQDKPLFLHLVAPRAYTEPPSPAHRIVTGRIHPCQDFAIFVGEPQDIFAKAWEGAWTNPIWSTNGLPEARPLMALWNSGDATLGGRIEEVNGKFVAHLQGFNRTTLNYYHGEIELEKPVYEQGGYYRGGTVWGVWFALSTNSDCSPHIKALEDGILQKPNVIDRNSPLREHWEDGKQNSQPRPPQAEQGGPGNRTQPGGPETNRTPAAAGPGR